MSPKKSRHGVEMRACTRIRIGRLCRRIARVASNCHSMHQTRLALIARIKGAYIFQTSDSPPRAETHAGSVNLGLDLHNLLVVAIPNEPMSRLDSFTKSMNVCTHSHWSNAMFNWHTPIPPTNPYGAQASPVSRNARKKIKRKVLTFVVVIQAFTPVFHLVNKKLSACPSPRDTHARKVHSSL